MEVSYFWMNALKLLEISDIFYERSGYLSLSKLYTNTNIIKQQRMSSRVEKKKPESFRIGKKFTRSKFRYHSQDKASSISSCSSQFSFQYLTLASKLKIKPLKQSTALSKIQNQTFYQRRNSLPDNDFARKTNFEAKSQSVMVNFIPLTEKSLKNTYTIDFQNINKRHLKNRKNKFLKVRQIGSYSQLNESQDQINPFRTLKSNTKLPKKQQVNIKSGLVKEKQNFINHAFKILDIFTKLSATKINSKQLQISVKTYILEKNQGKIHTAEQIFEDQIKVLFKQMIATQRVIILGIIDLIYHDKLGYLSNQCKILLSHILGMYMRIISQIIATKTSFNFGTIEKMCKQFMDKTQEENLTEKSQFARTNGYINSKLHLMFRFSPFLFDQLKLIINKATKMPINRIFYNLLTQYAVHLNKGSLQRLSTNFLKTFATCPSPFIPHPRIQHKKYTLVLDLDETLVHSTFHAGKCSVKYRPNAKNFTSNISAHFEIIIFTSSVSSYAAEILDNFEGVAHSLYRQHTIKTKGDTIKDLSRIGRPLQSIIIIDNLAQNFKLQPDNGIHIKSWYGSQKDTELINTEEYLKKLVQQTPSDVREYMKKNPFRSP